MTLLSSTEPTVFSDYCGASIWQNGTLPIVCDGAVSAVETTPKKFIWPEEYAQSDYSEASLFITDMISDPMIALLNEADGISPADFSELLNSASLGWSTQNTCQ